MCKEKPNNVCTNCRSDLSLYVLRMLLLSLAMKIIRPLVDDFHTVG